MVAPNNPNLDNLRTEYSEVSANIRWLADVRFKLLGLVPLATLVGGWFITADRSTINPLVSLFGLVITVALLIYNERNDQHYGELIGRAIDLERALELDEGQYGQRSGLWLTLWGVKVNHSTAVYLIYQASITVWVFGLLYPMLSYSLRNFVGAQSPLGDLTNTWIALISAGISVLCTWFFFWQLGRLKEHREESMRTAAKKAMGIMVGLPRQLTLNDERWQEACRHLAEIATFADDKGRRQWQASAKYYIEEHSSSVSPVLSSHVTEAWDVESAATLAARLTKLPRRWYKTMYRQLMTERGDHSSPKQATEGKP
jgi:hypothetical protein